MAANTLAHRIEDGLSEDMELGRCKMHSDVNGGVFDDSVVLPFWSCAEEEGCGTEWLERTTLDGNMRADELG